MKYPYLTDQLIQRAAEKILRAAFGELETISYPLDLDALVFDYLCETDKLIFDNEHPLGSDDGSEVLGKMLPFRGAILISSTLLARPHATGRYRFTVSHEIGHWVLHRPLFLAVLEQGSLFSEKNDEVALISLNRDVFPDSRRRNTPPEEFQANKFAVELLVGRSLLKRAFAERFGEGPLPRIEGPSVRAANLRQLSRNLASQRVKRHLPPLEELFGLSTESMAITLESQGYVVEGPLLTV